MKSMQSILKNDLHIPSSSTLIISVSGGVDSMTLLHMLKGTSYPLVVVHFNHLKRDQSVIEKDLVEQYCKSIDVPFHYYTIKVNQGNFHHQAHILREHYLNEVAKIYQTRYILTAHHLDDLFENVLIKLTRGSNLLGYAGMQQINETESFSYIKPLLYISKKEILSYAKENNISFLDDESNEENTYLRNRYRHSVVPIMKQENDMLLDQIKQYHNQISDVFFFIRNQTKQTIKNGHINLERFKTWDKVLQDDAIAYLIESYELNISYEIIQKIKRMLLSNKPNSIYRLNMNHCFIKSYQDAFIKPLTDKDDVQFLIKEGETRIGNMAIFTLLSKSSSKTEEFTKLCYNKLAFPLILRHRMEGDQLAYSYGHKKLKKLFIDEKIPMDVRNDLWILTDHDGTILWVQNHYLNQTLGSDQTLYFTLKEVRKHA
ncbi:MAG: tRNA lysidine(34) synthetase TilS [Acholeplasmataceae bacterium]|nr:tRNA lysidine(34) synthetase TilS [Acholeplasmataceae bacterium]